MGADGTWSAPSEVVRSPQLLANWADTPAVVRGGDGALYAAFPMLDPAADHAYHALLARSVDEGRSWSSPRRLNDDQTATEHGFVSMAPVPTGVTAVWLDGRAVAWGWCGPAGWRQEAPYPLVVDDGRVRSAFGVTAVPTTLVYAADGTLLWPHTGPLTADDAELRALLDGLR